LGDAYGTIDDWPDYLALGLGPEHIPDLIRLATDDAMRWEADDDDPALWGPIHAWRALGQLHAGAAAEHLLGPLRHIDDDDDDWAGEELPAVFGLIGPAAIPALATYLLDKEHGLWARVAAASGMRKIAERHPEARADCVAALTRALEPFADNDPALNGSLVSDLVDLKAVESAAVIERAFAAACVDETVMGDWEDAQVALGLKMAREHPRRPTWIDALIPRGLGPPVSQPERPVPEHLQRWNEAVEAEKRAKLKAQPEARSPRRHRRRKKS
jgi:hypothetical protein